MAGESQTLIKAFGLDKDDKPFTAETIEALYANLVSEYHALWLDIEAPTPELLHTVRDLFGLAEEAISDCIGGDLHPRIEEYEDNLFLLLYGAVSVEGDREFLPHKIAIFWNHKILITIHNQPSLTMRTLQKNFQANSAHVLRRGMDYLLYLVLDQLVDFFMLVVDKCDERINVLDDTSVSATLDPEFMAAINELRRDLIYMRRIAVSQRELLYPIAGGQYELISENLEPRFAHVVDHITKTIEIIDGLREILHGVRDNYQAALSFRLNRIMSTLTIFTSLFMPLTFIVGIYGMNLPLWPDPTRQLTFWLVMAVMLLIATVMLWFFKKRDWL